MADELTIRAILHFLKGSIDDEFSISDTVTVSGTKCLKNSQTVGTSAEALELGDISSPGYFAYKNTDATNYIEVRDGSGGADVVKISAGQSGFFELATTTPYVIADTASCELVYMIVEA